METAQPQLSLAPGDLLLGKYCVERMLGVGGMGAVVAARHLLLDQRVAIKLLLPEHVGETDLVARFEREARLCARIRSEHVARVWDVGALEDGTPYMVMEYLEGEDLQTLLRRVTVLPVAMAVDVVMQICEALAEAHDLGVVHRDLKPANLFCVPKEDGSLCVKVLDFGISKMMSEDLTMVRGVMGSPAYMSPEQVRSARSVDARSDIWAAGVVLYELLTGTVPFHGRTLPAIWSGVTTRPAPPVRQCRPEVPAGLDAVVRKCLQKEARDRYASARELADALAPFRRRSAAKRTHPPDRRAIAALGTSSATRSVPGIAIASSSRVHGSRTAWDVSRGWLAVACAVLLLAAAVVAARTREIARPTASSSGPRAGCILDLQSDPPAEVILDGHSVGSTPFEALAVSPGAHRLEFSHPGHEPYATEVQCRQSETKMLVVGLNPVAVPF